jgi:hypothetical protein
MDYIKFAMSINILGTLIQLMYNITINTVLISREERSQSVLPSFKKYYYYYCYFMATYWGTRCRIWLRHCATRRKDAGLIPEREIGIFH